MRLLPSSLNQTTRQLGMSAAAVTTPHPREDALRQRADRLRADWTVFAPRHRLEHGSPLRAPVDRWVTRQLNIVQRAERLLETARTDEAEATLGQCEANERATSQLLQSEPPERCLPFLQQREALLQTFDGTHLEFPQRGGVQQFARLVQQLSACSRVGVGESRMQALDRMLSSANRFPVRQGGVAWAIGPGFGPRMSEASGSVTSPAPAAPRASATPQRSGPAASPSVSTSSVDGPDAGATAR